MDPAAQAVPVCAVHPGAEAHAVCSRCGTFACPECLARPEAPALCRRCEQAQRADGWNPPWETRGQLGRWRAFGRTLKATLFFPATTLCMLSPRGGSSWEALSFSLGAYLLVPTALAAVPLLLDFNNLPFNLLALAPAAFLAPVAVVAMVLTRCGAEHLLLRLMRAAREPFPATLRAHCFSCAPAILGTLPFLGWIVSELWQAALRIAAYRRLHRTGWAQPVLAVSLPIGGFLAFAVGLFQLVSRSD